MIGFLALSWKWFNNLALLLDLNQLRADNLVTQGFKYTKESASNTVSGIRQWLYFCFYFGISILPATVESLVCYLELMSRTSGYQHLKHLLQSVKFLHLALDSPFPCSSFREECCAPVCRLLQDQPIWGKRLGCPNSWEQRSST